MALKVKIKKKKENAALYAAMIKGCKTKLLSKAEKEGFISRLSAKKRKFKADF